MALKHAHIYPARSSWRNVVYRAGSKSSGVDQLPFVIAHNNLHLIAGGDGARVFNLSDSIQTAIFLPLWAKA
ncbi:MAG: hypothetical protein KJP07_19755 [Desulfatitalea sp.]|nr:hypothetical protein [Desulfatitalea sp.]